MKVLITGGAGFIGFHLAKQLSSEGFEVVILDNLFRGQMDDDFRELISIDNVRFINIDLTEKEAFEGLEVDFDVIYHLAAINGTKYFYEMPEKVLRTNILSLINILDWIVRTKGKRIIWLSSSEVYAGTQVAVDLQIPTPEDISLIISDVSNPRYSYAGSKIAGELLCMSYASTYDLDIRIVRPHNIYGPRMGYEHVIPQFIMRILNGDDPFKIYGASQSRAFCYIDDFINSIKLLNETSILDTQRIVNIGSEEEIAILDLANRMFDLFDYHPELEMLQAPEGSVNRRCPDISLARQALGYMPRIDLNVGLKRTFDWYSRQDSGKNAKRIT